MMSPCTKTVAALAVATVAVIGSASSALAIRNRYTNQQAEGFAAYFFDDYRRPYRYTEYGYDDALGPTYAPYGYDRPYRPYRGHPPVEDYDE